MSDTPDGFTKQTWTYMGRRLTGESSLLYAWIDEQGEEHYFSKLKAHAIGRQYEVEASATSARPSSLKYVAGSTHPDREKWAIEDAAAYTQDEARKSHKRDEKAGKDLGDLTLSELRDLYWLSIGGRRAALLARVITYLEQVKP